MRELIICYLGEMALKGLNKNTFEAQLMKTIKRRLRNCGQFKYRKAQSTFYIEPENDECDIDTAFDKVKKIFGIAAVSKAAVVEKDFEVIAKTAVEYLGETLKMQKLSRLAQNAATKSLL